MSNEDEYTYKLRLEYGDIAKAANSILTIMGRADEAVDKINPTAKRAKAALVDLLGSLRGAKPVVVTVKTQQAEAALKRTKSQVDALTKSLNAAGADYAKFTRNQARGLTRPGGLQPARQSNAALATASQQGRAATASGATLSPGGRAYVTAVNAEITARAKAKAAALASRASESAAAQKAYEKAEAAAKKAAAAEIKAAQQVQAAEIKAAQQVQAAQAAADDKNYRSGVAAATRATNARIASKRSETAAIIAADKEQAEAAARAAATQQARRLAGSDAATTRINPTSAFASITGQRTAPTFTPAYTTGRNTAASNVLSGADRQAASAQSLGAMRAFYQEQENASKATERFNQLQRDEYQRQLPRTRYALYDVANASRIAGAAILGMGVAVISTAADYEDAYAQVKRTSDILTNPDLSGNQKNQQFAQLRQDLVDLSKQIPVTFQDITKIATLGNQLGIASSNIASFTDTVAKFSAVTGVSVDESATAFGRLGELLDNTDFKQIGDQIAYLGVTSVATEAQIIDTTTQLAVSLQSLNTLPKVGVGEIASPAQAKQIKETTAATLALSTTIASLGVQPEQARGTFIRAFGNIGSAVAGGGAKLNDLARISGTTSDQFAKNWGKGGTSAYEQFLKFTQGLGTNTGEINNNLKSIGIISVRDRQTFGLLAQNGTRAFKDLENASKGSKNNFLDQSFAVQSSTVIKRLQVLGQQVLAVFDKIGSQTIGPIQFLLDILQKVVGRLDDIASNPVQAAFLAFGAGALVIAGALILVVSGVGRFAANMIALQQILADTSGQGGAFIGILNAVTGTMSRTGLGAEALTAEFAALGLSEDAAAAAAARYNTQGAGVPSVAGKATGALSKLGKAAGGIGLAGTLISLVALAPTVLQFFNDLATDISGAVPEVDKLSLAIENLNDKKVTGARDIVDRSTQDFGTAPKGKNADYSVTFSPYGSTALKNPSGYKTITAGRAAVNQAFYGQQTRGKQTIDSTANVEGATKELENYDAVIAQFTANGDVKGAAKALEEFHAAMKQAGVEANFADLGLTKTRAALGVTGDASLETAQGFKAVADAEQEAQKQSDAFSSALSDIFDTNIASQAVTEDLKSVGDAVRELGPAAGLGGSAMKSALADIYASSTDMSIVKGRLQSVYDQLKLLGASDTDLQPLQDAILQIDGPTADVTVSMDGYTQAVKSAGDASGDAATKIRTLSDYASDLDTALTRAFEVRFGDQNSLDAITKGFRDMKSSISDSRDELKKAKADLAALKADQGVTEYQLSVANQFGDTARAAVLRAQLQQQNADIVDKQKDVKNAAVGANRSLTGNSDAAIANRASLEPQIQNGQAYLESLAKNGASQKELEAAAARLKKQFIDQAVQMGFSRKDVEKLAGAYDDMKAIIKKIPRNVDTEFKANTTPAEKAIAEYEASLDKIDGKTVTTKIVQQALNQADLPAEVLPGSSVGSTNGVPNYFLKGKGKRDGGLHGDSPVWQATSVVHGQEYVLNAQAQRMFPRQMLDGANHGVAPVIPRVTANATIGSGATFSSAASSALLAQAGGGDTLTVRGDRIGSALDDAFRRANRRGQA